MQLPARVIMKIDFALPMRQWSSLYSGRLCWFLGVAGPPLSCVCYSDMPRDMYTNWQMHRVPSLSGVAHNYYRPVNG